jgi:hypothetical protein
MVNSTSTAKHPVVRRPRVKRTRPPPSKATQTRSASRIQAQFHRWKALRRSRVLARIVYDKVYDESTGTHFYFNTHTSESQWVPPYLLGAEDFDSIPKYADFDGIADIHAARARHWKPQMDKPNGKM